MEKINLDTYLDAMAFLRSIGIEDLALIGWGGSLTIIIDTSFISSEKLIAIAEKCDFKLFSDTFDCRKSFRFKILEVKGDWGKTSRINS